MATDAKPAAQSDVVVPAAPVEAAAPAPAAPVEAAAPAAGAASAAPSLLATADAAKREGAPADAKPDSAAPVAEAKPGEDGKPDAGKPADKPAEAKAPEPGEKSADAKPDATGEKPAEKPADAAAEKPPAPPTYEPYKLPENFKPDDARIAKLNGILGETELATKADHAAIQQMGQKLVDFHAEEVARIAQEVAKHQVDVWNRHKEGLVNRLKSDPELGGNRIETTLGNAKHAFETHLGLSKDQQTELLTAMDNAGISDHPVMIRALHNLFERLREPEPAQPNLPRGPSGDRTRNWYEKTDVGSAA